MNERKQKVQFLPTVRRCVQGLAALSLGVQLLTVGCQQPSSIHPDKLENSKSKLNTLITQTVSKSVTRTDIKLGFADSLGINYKVFEDTIHPTSFFKKKRTALRFELGSLQKSQYEALMLHYGGQNLVSWNPDKKDWQLLDFLPPKIQALSGRWLASTTQIEPEIPEAWRNPYDNFSDPYVTIDMNCWTTSYEVLRDWKTPFANQSLQIGFFAGPDALSTFKKPEHHASQTDLSRDSMFAEKSKERNQGRSPGDLLVIHTVGSLEISPAHTAIWIDDDIYFEKTNSGGQDPFRLATWNDAVSPYLEQDMESYPVNMYFLDILGGASQLPSQTSFSGVPAFDLTDMFGEQELPDRLQALVFSLDVGMGGSMKVYNANRIVPLPLVQNPESGRAQANGGSQLKNFYKSEDLCWAGRTFGSTYTYALKSDSTIQVKNQQGVQVARVKAKISTQTDREELATGEELFTFAEADLGGGRKLTFSRDKNGGVTVFHSDVADDVFGECAQDRLVNLLKKIQPE